MTEHDIAEQAYKNGYSAGYEAGRRSAGERKQAQWLISCDGYYPYCSNCQTRPKHGEMTDYCPECGAYMKGERRNDVKVGMSALQFSNY